MDKVTLDSGLLMMLVDRFGVRRFQYAIDHIAVLSQVTSQKVFQYLLVNISIVTPHCSGCLLIGAA
jgi:hypothetical protein